jgi:ribosomal protein S18 acetylase RimI-like enzyme
VAALVRAARREDAAAIADVHVLTWQAAYEDVFGAERLAGIGDRRRAQWDEWLTDPQSAWQVSVAEEAGRVVGFVSVGESRDEAGKGELFAIYVLPEAWGSGAGSALMESALEELRGYSSATLWVLEDNPRARRFYEREGWLLDGGRREEELLGVTVTEVRYRITFD